MDFDWKGTLAKVAPAIATAIGGPFAGVATKIAADALGIEATPEALEQAVMSGDPDILLKLKQANHDFLLKMRELDIRESQLEYSDRQDAREREEKLGGSFVTALGSLILIGFFAMVYYVLSGGAVVDSVLAGTLIGYVSAKAEQVTSYFYGSSRGSKEKTKAMADAMKNAAR